MWSRKPKLLELEELMDYAGKALTARAQSIAELKSRLTKRAAKPEYVAQVLARLKDSGLIDDRKFAAAYADWRRENEGFGQTRVLRDLIARKVAPEVAKKALTSSFKGTNEIEMIESFLARKYRGKDLGSLLKEEKHLASAYRKLRLAGFGTSNSIRVLKRYSEQAAMIEETPDEPE